MCIFIIIFELFMTKSCVFDVYINNKPLPSYMLLIEAGWRMYASVNCDINGSDNGLSPGRRQAIIWPSAENC